MAQSSCTIERARTNRTYLKVRNVNAVRIVGPLVTGIGMREPCSIWLTSVRRKCVCIIMRTYDTCMLNHSQTFVPCASCWNSSLTLCVPADVYRSQSQSLDRIRLWFCRLPCEANRCIRQSDPDRRAAHAVDCRQDVVVARLKT